MYHESAYILHLRAYVFVFMHSHAHAHSHTHTLKPLLTPTHTLLLLLKSLQMGLYFACKNGRPYVSF